MSFQSLSGLALIKANLLTTFGMILFSLSLPILEVLTDRYSVTALVVIRNILSGGFLVCFGLIVERQHRLSRDGWRHAMIAGGVWYLITMICVTYAVAFTGALSTAIILSLIPVVSAIVDVITGKDRIGPRLALALLVSIAGGTLASIGLGSGSDAAFQLSFGFGEAMLLFGVFAWVMMSRHVDTHMKSEPPITAIGMVILIPGVILSIVMVYLEQSGIESSGLVRVHSVGGISSQDILLMLFLGIVSSAGSMVIWFKSVSLLGVTIASLQQNLVPVFVLVQVAILGQSLEPVKIFGGVLVVAGALIAQMRKITPAILNIEIRDIAIRDTAKLWID